MMTKETITTRNKTKSKNNNEGENGRKQPKTHETNKEWQQRNGKTKFMHVSYKVDVTLNSSWSMLVIRKCSFLWKIITVRFLLITTILNTCIQNKQCKV